MIKSRLSMKGQEVLEYNEGSLKDLEASRKSNTNSLPFHPSHSSNVEVTEVPSCTKNPPVTFDIKPNSYHKLL